MVPDGPAAEEEPKGAEEVSGNDEKHQDVYDGIEAARRREAKVETENRRLDEKNREIPGDGDGEDVELEAALVWRLPGGRAVGDDAAPS